MRLEERPESPTRPSTFDQPTIELVSEFRQAYTENETWAVEFPRRPITNDPQQPAMQVLYREAGQVIRPGQINQLLQSNTLRPHVIAAIIMRRLFTQVNEQDLFNEWISRDANVGSLVNYVNANPALFPSPEARRAHVFQMIIGNQREYRAWRTELLDRVLHGNAGLLNLFRPAIPENVQENAFQQLRDIVRTMIDLIFRMYTFPRLWTITWRPYIDQGAVNSRYVHQQFFRDNMTARNTPEGQTELGLQGELVALFITPIIGYRDTTGGTIRVDTILRSWVIVKVWRP